MNLDEVAAHGILGDEAEKFKESELGRCLIAMAEQEAAAALEDLATADPEDFKAIRALQNRIHLGRQFQLFIEELIQKGKQAQEIWKHESQNN